ncbi:MAG: hypothetical protein ACYCVZ_09835 [Streptosporangiaceae bacterium]
MAGLAALYWAGLVLPAWWLSGLHSAAQPGLTSYPSAYIGDTLLLPTGVAVLVAGIRRLPRSRWEPVTGLLAAAAAAAVSVAVQIDWLTDPTTPTNWTMPVAGHLDPAGWWHFAYFTGMSMVMITVTAVFLTRVRAIRLAAPALVADLSSGRSAVLLFAAWGSYAALSVHSDLTTALTSSAAATIALTAIVLTLALGLVWLGYGWLTRVLAWPALAAIPGIAVVLGFVLIPLDNWLVVTVLVGAIYQAFAADAGRRAVCLTRWAAGAGRSGLDRSAGLGEQDPHRPEQPRGVLQHR